MMVEESFIFNRKQRPLGAHGVYTRKMVLLEQILYKLKSEKVGKQFFN